MIVHLPIGLLESNCYLIVAPASDPARRAEAALVDPGVQDISQLMDKIHEHGTGVRYILNTHGHFDHIAANGRLELPGALLGIHPADRPLLLSGGGADLFGMPYVPSPYPTLDLNDGDTLLLGNDLRIEILHTPGHTPGSVCLYVPSDQALLTGDTLFADNVGRTDLPGGNARALTASLHRIMTLPQATRIYPGHGYPVTLAEARRINPWLRRLG